MVGDAKVGVTWAENQILRKFNDAVLQTYADK